jgi:hypothetical protein
MTLFMARRIDPLPNVLSVWMIQEQKQGIHKVLGVQWDVSLDEFCSDLMEVIALFQ